MSSTDVFLEMFHIQEMSTDVFRDVLYTRDEMSTDVFRDERCFIYKNIEVLALQMSF